MIRNEQQQGPATQVSSLWHLGRRARARLTVIALRAAPARRRDTVTVRDSLRRALEKMRGEGVRELPVVDDDERVVGFIDEGALAHLYLASSPQAPPSQRGS